MLHKLYMVDIKMLFYYLYDRHESLFYSYVEETMDSPIPLTRSARKAKTAAMRATRSTAQGSQADSDTDTPQKTGDNDSPFKSMQK